MEMYESSLLPEYTYEYVRELQTSTIAPELEEINDDGNEANSTMVNSSEPSWMPSVSPSHFPSGMASMAPTKNAFINSNDSQIVRDTFRVYGSVYLVFFISFCIMRKYFNKYVNIRSWVPEIKNERATNAEYGFVSWAWKVFSVTDDELLETCGMDALCYLRCLRLGTKFTIMGTINSMWLVPLYLTAESSRETDLLSDPFVLMSVANVPIESLRFIGTIVATYITVLVSLYLVVNEFDWYAEYRHKYQSQRKPRNYAIYVSGIPEEYRSSYSLADYFRQCTSWQGAVYEAHVTMDIPSLEAKVARRKFLVEKLEHVTAFEQKRGFKPTHHTMKLMRGEGMKRVDSIQTFTDELINLNSTIALEVGRITRSNHRMRQHLTKILPSRNLNLDVDDSESEEWKDQTQDLYTSSNLPRLALRGSSRKSLSSMRRGLEGPSSTRVECFSDIEEGSLPSEYALDFMGNSSHPSPHDGSQNALPTESSTEAPAFGDEPVSRNDDLNEEDERADSVLTSVGLNKEIFDSSSYTEAEPRVIGLRGLSFDVSEEIFEDTSFEVEPAPTQRDEEKCNPQVIEVEEVGLTFEESVAHEHDGVIAEGSRDVSDTSCAICAPSEPSNSSDPSRNSRVGPGIIRKTSSRISSDSTSSWMLGDAIRSTSASVSCSVRSSVKKVSKGTMHVGDQVKKASKVGVSTVKAAGSIAGSGVKMAAELGLSTLQQAPDLGKTVGASLVSSAAAVVPLRFGRSEGEPRAAGFVVFRDLYTTQAARQMLQHHVATCMMVEPAPDPEEIFWPNVGLPAQSRRSGRMLSLFATSVLCLFWSIPMAFFSSLTEVNSLKEKLPNLGELTAKHRSLESLLALMAPLLLLIMNELILPFILKYFATWEGHVGASLLDASLFVKLCAFVMIQAFFVSALSGTITAELANFLEEPEKIADFLANSLPAQSSYFIQICLVFTFLLQGLDLVRAYPLGVAFLRRYFFGPNLTVEERKKSWGWFNSLEDPPDFWHAELLAQIMLFFVVFFVYSAIAPITSPFLLFCFLILESGYRYHFIHNQKPAPDSGGKLWPGFIHVIIASQLIGQFTLFGLLVLKRTVYALPALLPCGLITLLFAIFVVPRRIHVANFLPTLKCAEVDKRFHEAGDNVKFFAAKSYLQPALRAEQMYPQGSELPRVRTRTMSLDGTR